MKRYHYSPLLLSLVMLAGVACGKTSDATSTVPTTPTPEEKTPLTRTKTAPAPSDNESLLEVDDPLNPLKEKDRSLAEETSATPSPQTRSGSDTVSPDKQSDTDNNVLSGDPLDPTIEVARHRVIVIEEGEFLDSSEDVVYDPLAPEQEVAEMRIENLGLLNPEAIATDDENILKNSPLELELLPRPTPGPESVLLPPEDETNILSTEPLELKLVPRLEPIAPLPEERINVISIEPLEAEVRTPGSR